MTVVKLSLLDQPFYTSVNEKGLRFQTFSDYPWLTNDHRLWVIIYEYLNDLSNYESLKDNLVHDLINSQRLWVKGYEIFMSHKLSIKLWLIVYQR